MYLHEQHRYGTYQIYDMGVIFHLLIAIDIKIFKDCNRIATKKRPFFSLHKTTIAKKLVVHSFSGIIPQQWPKCGLLGEKDETDCIHHLSTFRYLGCIESERMGENPTTQNVDETLDEYEYFEEEVVSQYEYETMLSTILEGDYESCSSQKSNTSKPVNMRIEINVPQNISLTPTDQRPPQESSKLWALLSPMMFSPISDARKLKIFSQKTPLFDVKQNPSAVASSTRPETKSSTITPI